MRIVRDIQLVDVRLQAMEFVESDFYLPSPELLRFALLWALSHI